MMLYKKRTYRDREIEIGKERENKNPISINYKTIGCKKKLRANQVQTRVNSA